MPSCSVKPQSLSILQPSQRPRLPAELCVHVACHCRAHTLASARGVQRVGVKQGPVGVVGPASLQAQQPAKEIVTGILLMRPKPTADLMLHALRHGDACVWLTAAQHV